MLSNNFYMILILSFDIYMGKFEQQLNNGRTFSQHTNFWISVTTPNAFCGNSSQLQLLQV